MNALKIVSNYSIEDCVFWVGAGISYPTPTCLPLGWDLTKFAIKETCGEFIQSKIFEIWNSANQISKTSEDNQEPLGKIPRLESILGEIDEVQSKLINYDFNFLQGFSAFQYAPYNANHLHIAELMREGANVITTNFDLCIQNAYAKLTNNNLLTLKIEKGVCAYSTASNNTGKLWHIHGISTEITTLGATVRKVKEGIPEEFQKFLDEIIEQGKHFVFLGYSASDSFDVNIYFQNKPPTVKSNAIFIQHGSTKPPFNASQLGRGFREFLIENHDTTNFLSAITKLDTNITDAAFNWQNAFQKFAKPDKKGLTKPLLVCKIANMLGVNIDKIKPSAYEDTFQIEEFYESVDFHKTLAIVQRTRGDALKEKSHDTTVKTKEADLLGYYYSQGNYKKALEYAKSVKELFTDAENFTAELEWATYTSMSAHCRPLVTKHLKSLFAKSNQDDLAKIKSLLKITDMLGHRPLRNVKFVNQIATALRFNFIFNAILGNNDIENEKTVLHLYGEGASIVGYVSVFRDIAIKNYFLAKHNQRKVFFKEAQKYASKSYELANLIGDYSGMKRAKQLVNSFKILSSLYW